MEPVHPVGDVRTAPYGTPFGQALSDLRPRLLDLTADSSWLAADPARAEAIRAAGAHSLITAPLTLRGTVLGLLSLYRCGQTEPYSEDDIDLALELAAHTALCIDNARRFTRERTIAATTQRRLLPQSPGPRTAVDTAWLHLPADLGASWFDTIALPGARTALVTGNATGHGISAATTMGQLRTAIHALAALDLEPDELLARLHDTTGRLAEERAALPPADPLHNETLTASCIYGVYDPITRICAIARAGTPHRSSSTRTARPTSVTSRRAPCWGAPRTLPGLPRASNSPRAASSPSTPQPCSRMRGRIPACSGTS